MQFVVSPCISIATSLVKVSITFVVTFVAVHIWVLNTLQEMANSKSKPLQDRQRIKSVYEPSGPSGRRLSPMSEA